MTNPVDEIANAMPAARSRWLPDADVRLRQKRRRGSIATSIANGPTVLSRFVTARAAFPLRPAASQRAKPAVAKTIHAQRAVRPRERKAGADWPTGPISHRSAESTRRFQSPRRETEDRNFG